jgi:hypothetical protein
LLSLIPRTVCCISWKRICLCCCLIHVAQGTTT